MQWTVEGVEPSYLRCKRSVFPLDDTPISEGEDRFERSTSSVQSAVFCHVELLPQARAMTMMKAVMKPLGSDGDATLCRVTVEITHTISVPSSVSISPAQYT